MVSSCNPECLQESSKNAARNKHPANVAIIKQRQETKYVIDSDTKTCILSVSLRFLTYFRKKKRPTIQNLLKIDVFLIEGALTDLCSLACKAFVFRDGVFMGQ